MNKIEWPIIGVNNLQEAVDYYLNSLNFDLNTDKNKLNGHEEVKIKLFDFLLVLRKDGKGPIYETSNKRRIKRKVPFFSFKKILIKILGHNYIKQAESKSLPALYIPVPDINQYFNAIKNKGSKILTENKFLSYDFEGFYVHDNEGNKLLFFRDYHGTYNPNSWEWVWE